MSHRRAALAVSVLVVAGIGTFYALTSRDRESGVAAGVRVADGEWQPSRPRPKARIVSPAERDDMLGRAHVWQPPAVAIEEANLGNDPAMPRELRCRFHVTELGGTTPKFDCDLENGELIRIKYGRTGEVNAEIAASRLLRALGFSSDSVNFVERLRCYGCPEEPFSTMKAVEITQAEKLYKRLMLRYDSFEEFEWVAIERKFPARPVEMEHVAGWGMFELAKIDASKGGAPRAHVDALRLMAVFLAHWDNKPENQRLVCLSQWDWQDGQRCDKPFLLLQDLGATFGPARVDLDKWSNVPIWLDRATCHTSMRELPYDGATFEPVYISEQGRRLLAGLLTRLTDQQITTLFSAARFDDPLGIFGRRGATADWVRVFKDHVHQIADGPPCRSTT